MTVKKQITFEYHYENSLELVDLLKGRLIPPEVPGPHFENHCHTLPIILICYCCFQVSLQWNSHVTSLPLSPFFSQVLGKLSWGSNYVVEDGGVTTPPRLIIIFFYFIF